MPSTSIVTPKVETANVVVTFDSDTASKLLQDLKRNPHSSSKDTLLRDFEQANPDTFIFGYRSPRNLLSFSHSLLFESGGSGGEAPIIKMEVIDPETEFERKIFGHGNLAQLTNDIFAVKSKSDVPHLYPGLLQEYIEEMKGENAGDEEATETMVEEATTQLFGDIQQEQADQGGNAFPMLYIFYGVGTDFTNWAGPFAVMPAGVKNIYTGDGPRKLSLTFFVSNNLLGRDSRGAKLDLGFNESFGARELIDIKFIQDFITGQEPPGQKGYYTYDKSYGMGGGAGGGTAEGGGAGDLLSENKELVKFAANAAAGPAGGLAADMLIEDPGEGGSAGGGGSKVIPKDFHQLIVKIIAKYIREACPADLKKTPNQENVIVLLPNMNKLAQTKARQLMDAQENAEEVREIKIGDCLTRWGVSDINNKAGGGRVTIDTTTMNGGLVMSEMLSELGLLLSYPNMDETEGEGGLTCPPRINSGNCWELKISEDGQPDYGGDGNQQNVDAIYGQGFYVSLKKATVESHDRRLTRFLNALRNYLNLDISPVIKWENDLNLLATWKEEGIIKSDATSVCLVGDSRLINFFAYGGSEFWNAIKPGASETFNKMLYSGDSETFTSQVVQNINKMLYPAPAMTSYTPLFFNDKNVKEVDENSRMPLFKAGVKNSNIISLNVDTRNHYFVNLFYNFTTNNASLGGGGTIATTAPATLSPTQAKQDAQTLIDANNWDVDAYKAALAIIAATYGADEAEKLEIQQRRGHHSAANIDILKTYLKKIYSVGGALPDGTSYELDPNSSPNADMIITKLVDRMRTLYVGGTVKTLPLMQISSFGHLIRPVYMLVKEQRVHGQHATGIKQNLLKAKINSFYTGFWTIEGFKHTINNGDVSSEFKIFRANLDTGQLEAPGGEMGDEIVLSEGVGN